MPALRRVRAPALAQALTEGAVLAGYRFDRYRSAGEDGKKRVGFTGGIVREVDDATASQLWVGKGSAPGAPTGPAPKGRPTGPPPGAPTGPGQ